MRRLQADTPVCCVEGDVGENMEGDVGENMDVGENIVGANMAAGAELAGRED